MTARNTTAVSALWASAWRRLAAEHPDVEQRLAELEQVRPTRFRSLERLASAAGREAGRCHRGMGDFAELEARLRKWESAVLDALAELDHQRSLSLCADCGASGVPTVAPGLTGGRICARCLREAAA